MKENLAPAVMIAERFSGKNATLPILGNVLLEVEKNSLKIIATNLEYAVEVILPGEGVRPGQISVPAKIISSLLQSLREEKIELEEKQGNLFVKTPARDIRINGISAEDFPLLPKIKKKNTCAMESFQLKRGLERVIPAVSLSEFKPELAGVYFKITEKSLQLAATDTFRLAEHQAPILKNNEGGNFSFILPQRVSTELARILGGDDDVKISLGENQVEFQTGGLRVISRLIDGVFPEYSSIVPKNFETTCFLKREGLIDTIRASSIFTSKMQEVALTIQEKKGVLEIASNNTEIGEYKTKLPAAVTGKGISVSFNHRFLLDGLNALDEEELFFGLNSQNAPSMLRNKSGGSYLYVVMPIRAS